MSEGTGRVVGSSLEIEVGAFVSGPNGGISLRDLPAGQLRELPEITFVLPRIAVVIVNLRWLTS